MWLCVCTCVSLAGYVYLYVPACIFACMSVCLSVSLWVVCMPVDCVSGSVFVCLPVSVYTCGSIIWDYLQRERLTGSCLSASGEFGTLVSS